MQRLPPSLRFLAVLAACSTLRAESPTDTLRVAIVQSGYPGSPRAAESFLKTLTAHLEAATGFTGITATYDNVPAGALASLEKAPAAFGVVSLGFYLEHRHRLGLRALLETSPQEKFFVIAKKGGATSLADLRQSSVAGGALHEPRFVGWIVFPEAAVDEWKIEPTLRPSRALRSLDRGEHRAVVLNSREYHSYEALGSLQNTTTIAESKPFPVAVAVAFAEKPPASDEDARGLDGAKTEDDPPNPRAARLATAFSELAATKGGSELLATMGCREFRAVDRERLEPIERLFDAHLPAPKESARAENPPAASSDAKRDDGR